MLGIIAHAAPIETVGKLLHSALRQELQNIGESRGGVAGPQGLLDKLRNALFDAHLAAQGLRDAGALRLDAGDQIQSLLHG